MPHLHLSIQSSGSTGHCKWPSETCVNTEKHVLWQYETQKQRTHSLLVNIQINMREPFMYPLHSMHQIKLPNHGCYNGIIKALLLHLKLFHTINNNYFYREVICPIYHVASKLQALQNRCWQRTLRSIYRFSSCECVTRQWRCESLINLPDNPDNRY